MLAIRSSRFRLRKLEVITHVWLITSDFLNRQTNVSYFPWYQQNYNTHLFLNIFLQNNGYENVSDILLQFKRAVFYFNRLQKNAMAKLHFSISNDSSEINFNMLYKRF